MFPQNIDTCGRVRERSNGCYTIILAETWCILRTVNIRGTVITALCRLCNCFNVVVFNFQEKTRSLQRSTISKSVMLFYTCPNGAKFYLRKQQWGCWRDDPHSVLKVSLPAVAVVDAVDSPVFCLRTQNLRIEGEDRRGLLDWTKHKI